jgi:hypothetical protein
VEPVVVTFGSAVFSPGVLREVLGIADYLRVDGYRLTIKVEAQIVGICRSWRSA